MKKGVLVLVLAGLSVLLSFSCATTPSSVSKTFVFDDSVPAEQLTEVQLQNLGTITGYNGIAVNWKQDGLLGGWRDCIIKIPAGDTLFEFDLYVVWRPNYYVGKGALFRYNFLPNKKYALVFSALDWREKDRIYGLNVYTFEIGEKVPAFLMGIGRNQPNFTEFVPFVNAQGKIVLE